MIKLTSCDTSFLINFLKIDRLDLLDRCSHSFLISEHVLDEITNCYTVQRSCLEKGLRQNILKQIKVDTAEELDTFVQLNITRQLGAGECASIALAYHRDYFLAIDDIQAIKKALVLLPASRILRTQDLILLMIQEQLLDINEADQLIDVWATQHRFQIKIKSFREILAQSSVGLNQVGE